MSEPQGLLQWNAPETRSRGVYTEAVDLWGVGCIMYYIMNKQEPFVDSNEDKLFEKI